MIKQLSVFLPNQPGQLEKLTNILLEKNINIRAISVADTADYGILRMLVDKTDECIEILKERNFLVNCTYVIAVEIHDNPGALHEITKILSSEDINIEYLYSTMLKDEAIIILRIDNIDKAVEALKKNNIKLLNHL